MEQRPCAKTRKMMHLPFAREGKSRECSGAGKQRRYIHRLRDKLI